MPAPTTCAPSTTWKMAAMARNETPSAITCAFAGVSSRNRVISSRGIDQISSAIIAMKPTPRTQAVQPARVMPTGSPLAEKQPDPHRRRLAEPQRHHEGQCRDLQRDRMRGDRFRVDQAHQIGGGAEHAAFEPHRQADREAEPPQLAVARPVGPPEAAEQVEAAELAVGDDDQRQHQRQQRPDDRAGQPAAENAQRRQAEMAEDQPIAEQRVEHDAGQADHQHPAGPLQRRDEVAHRLEQQERHHRPHVAVDEASGRRGPAPAPGPARG